MAAYYNEIDPFAAQWLRNLITAGHIAPGDVDERSITEVRPNDLAGFDQCHFFAGIGVWSYALRGAGWTDDRPVWTGSCPCQPFSAAGASKEFADERHLWPAWFELIRERRPVAVFGEQVASRDALAWLDHVCADLEGEGYAVGAVDTCAAGYGAPHIRQRLYWVAQSELGIGDHLRQASDEGRQTLERWRTGVRPGNGTTVRSGIDSGGTAIAVADADGAESGFGKLGLFAQGGNGDGPARNSERQISSVADDNETGRSIVRSELPQDGHAQPRDHANGCGELERMGNTAYSSVNGCGNAGTRRRRESSDASFVGDASGAGFQGHERPGDVGLHRGPGAHGPTATAGFWRDAEWLPCCDGKARPTEPGTFPLVARASSRVGRLRAYGNSIVAPQAAEFIRAFMTASAQSA